MMLDGKKDFSVFSRHARERTNPVGSQKFARYKSKILSKELAFEDTTYLFYYQKNSVWKVDSFIALMQCRTAVGASEQTEFLEGLLLGYTLEQNMEYIKKFWQKTQRVE